MIINQINQSLYSTSGGGMLGDIIIVEPINPMPTLHICGKKGNWTNIEYSLKV